ncbi:MAG TPA: TPM domain-containing protein [Ignavibacteriales bacterium]|nr:TPM domain-containing protein [Ignavibacteriales bacterium]
MKKKSFLFLLIFLLSVQNLFAQRPEIPNLRSWATDFTGTLSEEELNYLNQDLKTFSDTTSNQVVFLMISSIGDYPLEEYSYEVASQNKIGTKKNMNGILFLVVKDDRKFRIEVGYGLEGALPDALSNSILRNEVKPYFQRGDYFQGVRAGLDAIKAAIKGEYKAAVKKHRGTNFKGFGTFLIILLFILFNFIFRGRGRGRGGFIFWGGGGGFGGFGGGSSGGGGGFGGFSGGGGSFGGGGSSGSW